MTEYVRLRPGHVLLIRRTGVGRVELTVMADPVTVTVELEQDQAAQALRAFEAVVRDGT